VKERVEVEMRDATTEVLEERELGRFVAWAALLSSALFGLFALLHYVAPDLVRNGVTTWPIEVYPACAGFAFLALAVLAARRHRHRLQVLLPLACVLLVGIMTMPFVRQAGGVPSWDFRCYYEAGMSVRHGADIYQPQSGGWLYRYFPLLATVFSAAEMLPASGRLSATYTLWGIANCWAVLIYMLLLTAVLRSYRVSGPYLWPVMAAAMICNVPLQRTLSFSQVNLHVMNLILGLALLRATRPFAAGGLLGAAALLKTSPALLLVSAVAARNWRIVAGFAVGGAALAGGSMAVVGVKPWWDYFHAAAVMHSEGIYRDNSLQSLFLAVGTHLGMAQDSPGLMLAGKLAALAAALGLIWLALQPRWRAVFVGPDGDFVLGSLPLLLLAMVVGSPMIWEHHWLFLQLPLLLLVVRAWETRYALSALFIYGIVFLMPIFDSLPLSYHRLAALAWWLVVVWRMSKEAGQVRSNSRGHAGPKASLPV
jgi:hypothetical protein